MNITNELMAEVLVTIKEVYDIEEHGANVLWYGKSYEGGFTKGGMNISEVVSRLKILMIERHCPIELKLSPGVALLRLTDFDKSFIEDTEDDAICEAYKWLLFCTST